MKGEKKNFKTNDCNNLPNLGSVAEKCLGYFALRTGFMFKMDPFRQKRAAESKLRCGKLISSGNRGLLRGRRDLVHHVGLESTRVSTSAA